MPFRQNALLATISEKDANIALLELSPTVGSDDEVKKFKAEKDKLVNELKEQVANSNVAKYFLKLLYQDTEVTLSRYRALLVSGSGGYINKKNLRSSSLPIS